MPDSPPTPLGTEGEPYPGQVPKCSDAACGPSAIQHPCDSRSLECRTPPVEAGNAAAKCVMCAARVGGISAHPRTHAPIQEPAFEQVCAPVPALRLRGTETLSNV